MPRFYLDAALRAGTSVLLPEDSAHHAVHVLRVHDGDEITLFNGRGGEYAARIASIQRLKVLGVSDVQEMSGELVDDARAEHLLAIIRAESQ